MAAVAKQLNVATGALYGYVQNRDDLIQMALVRKVSSHSLPAASGLHWSEFMFAQAHALREMYFAAPEMLVHVLEGRPGPEATLEAAEVVLGVLMASGFDAADATLLMDSVTATIIGSVANAIYRQKAEAGGDLLEERVRRAVMIRPADDLPVHHQHMATVMAVRFRVPWQHIIYLILKDWADQRGEVLRLQAPPVNE